MSRKKIIRYASEDLQLDCEWNDCVEISKNLSEFLDHINVHLSSISEDNNLQCPWQDCNFMLDTIAEFRQHIYFHVHHTKIKSFGKNLIMRNSLQPCSLETHSRNLIPELLEKFTCYFNHCGETFEIAELFYRHIDYHAEDKNLVNPYEKNRPCKWLDCSCSFNHLAKFKEHLRSHTQEKVISCPTCGGMFVSRTKFFDHLQRQLSSQGFQCEYCSRTLPSERLLKDHMRHHVSHYKCPYCDMTCPTPSGLRNHIKYRHSKDRPFVCHQCEYRCKSQNDLARHLSTHNEEIEYKCPEENCDFSSKSQTCFLRHARQDHESDKNKIYACHLCDKIFNRRGHQLTKHLVTSHNFQWPSGHCRFRYYRHADGSYRLQTVRYESVELSETMLQQSDNSEVYTLSESANEENETKMVIETA